MADAPELFLIDGNSLAYRAFFALPESIGTSDGRPTNAIYGLASMLVKVIDEHHPAGVVVAWDAGMSGREVTYDLYKAQRKPRPDLLRDACTAAGILVCNQSGTNKEAVAEHALGLILALSKQIVRSDRAFRTLSSRPPRMTAAAMPPRMRKAAPSKAIM